MTAASRGVVYSLLTVVFVLLLGIAALLAVAYHRHQRLEDATQDLRRNLTQQEGQIKNLQQRLEDCDTVEVKAPVDTSWNSSSVSDSVRVVSQNTPDK
ncbi:hypothetical protein G8759_05890 [Spirosoma aureum]|uniref:Uncharacterized protein n=1 Tax=Spirosoma aureum TaxID=2692134 RepID=A0A6G9AIM7_9BACT|nr:hypothetical protein [Spirosoma aureum]QIP12194.1 hypothetical protein G8759_05890 [Spirosoma aureum]